MKQILILWLCAVIIPCWSALANGQDAEAPTTENATPEDDSGKDTRAQRLPSNVPRQQVPANKTAYMETLSQALADKDKKVNWLDPDDRSFLTLWQEDRSGSAKGAILILHGEGEHTHWPNTIQPLHNTLPDYGWATLAISLPQKVVAKTPKRTRPPKEVINTPEPVISEDAANANDTPAQAPADNATAANSEPTPNTTNIQADMAAAADKLADTIEQRLSAALQFLHDRGQFNIVFVGNDSNAIHAHQFIARLTPKLTDQRLQRQLEKPVRAMIIVNARNRLSSMQEDYNAWFNDPDLMVLDVITSQHLRHHRDGEKRKVLARQNKVTTYKHVKLPPLSTTSWGENMLSRRIRSFLDANVQGVQVDRATVNRY